MQIPSQLMGLFGNLSGNNSNNGGFNIANLLGSLQGVNVQNQVNSTQQSS
jgi:hypothetical protein